jgi:anti-anti-sigma regulatory factor
MRFEMAKRGSMFSTYDRSHLLLAELESELASAGGPDKELIIDFEGVHHVGGSFVKAFIGGTQTNRREAGLPAAKLENMSPAVEQKVETALRRGESARSQLQVA